MAVTEQRKEKPTSAALTMNMMAMALRESLTVSMTSWRSAVKPRSARLRCNGPARSSLSSLAVMLYPVLLLVFV